MMSVTARTGKKICKIKLEYPKKSRVLFLQIKSFCSAVVSDVPNPGHTTRAPVRAVGGTAPGRGCSVGFGLAAGIGANQFSSCCLSQA